jgi:hypothetical protein
MPKIGKTTFYLSSFRRKPFLFFQNNAIYLKNVTEYTNISIYLYVFITARS